VKSKTILYWITTSLIALETFVGGVVDLAHGRTAVVAGPPVTGVIASLGYPEYVLVILGIFKIPGALTLVAPRLLRLKEWAYAGIVFELLGAAASHIARGHGGEAIGPLFLTAFALASWALRPPSRTLGSLSRSTR
jgi:hypothetical protein